MAKSALITGDVFKKHKPPRGIYHPERPERIDAILSKGVELAKKGLVDLIEPRQVELSEAARIHDERYVRDVVEASYKPTFLDPDTYVGPGTIEAALHALGTAYEAARLILEGRYEMVFAAVRPPGHHAGRDRAAGFCIFNNIAYAAQRLLDEGKVSRITILDIDAHWGDGTAEIFYDTPKVLYISFHQDPRTLYPGRGFPEELGSGEGRGYTVNIIMPPYATDNEYLVAWDEVARPIIEQYKPDLILVSLGFDAHRDDPLTDLCLSLTGYWQILHEAYKLAKRLTNRGLAVMLEGGYDLRVLSEGTANTLLAYNDEAPVSEEPWEAPGEAKGRFRRFLERVKTALKPYWDI